MTLFGQEHIDRYIETDGEEGYEWRGTRCLLLFTKGRKSGEQRIAPLIFEPYGDASLVVASKGGAPEPPAWYVNLHAHPDDVEIQIKGDRFKVRPRDASPEEKPDMWKTMTAVWPDYDEYQKKTDREIPIVVLERA